MKEIVEKISTIFFINFVPLIIDIHEIQTDCSISYFFQMGDQNYYSLNLTVVVDGAFSDDFLTPFGMRQVTSEVDDNGHRIYQVNGQNLLVRGAGWSPELFQRTSVERQTQEFTYVRGIVRIFLEISLISVTLFVNQNQLKIPMEFSIDFGSQKGSQKSLTGQI